MGFADTPSYNTENELLKSDRKIYWFQIHYDNNKLISSCYQTITDLQWLKTPSWDWLDIVFGIFCSFEIGIILVKKFLFIYAVSIKARYTISMSVAQYAIRINKKLLYCPTGTFECWPNFKLESYSVLKMLHVKQSPETYKVIINKYYNAANRIILSYLTVCITLDYSISIKEKTHCH